MPRARTHTPLRVLLNNREVGLLTKAPGGAVSFRYDHRWLEWEHRLPISLSLPLRADAFRGEPVLAVFDNLLPDAEELRRKVAEKVGATGTDPYNMLSVIGQDCIGALQFIPQDRDPPTASAITGDPISRRQIAQLLKGLAKAPLGLAPDEDFRISLAGAQEKTALLWDGRQWLKPRGTTPTTHIFKTPIGITPDGIDLSDSVENEFYCMHLAAACGLDVADTRIETFGDVKALVVERFDRRWTNDGRLLRLPQEDFCQALGVPPTRKYQNRGGPSLVQMLDLLKGSDNPARDQATLFRAQAFFWLIGATDGHAKNFSIFLTPGGTYRLTPLYDIQTTQPQYDTGALRQRDMKLSLSLGQRNHYRVDEIGHRHFMQTAAEAKIPAQLVNETLDSLLDALPTALDQVDAKLPSSFPCKIPNTVRAAALKRVEILKRHPA